MQTIARDFFVSLPDGRSCWLYLRFVPPLTLTQDDLQTLARIVLDKEAAPCN